MDVAEDGTLGPPAPKVVIASPAGSIPERDLRTGALADAGVLNIDPNLPYIIFVNTDTATHTLTASPRASNAVGQAKPPIAVLGGNFLPLPTAVFGGVADAQGNGLVYWFYSDVPLFPRGATGSGPIQFPTGASITDDGNGGILFTGANGETDKIDRNGNVIIGTSVNAEINNNDGQFGVYGTEETSAKGVSSVVGPSSAFPSDTGFTQFTGAHVSQVGSTWHPNPPSTKTLTVRARGYLDITALNIPNRTYSVTVVVTDETGTATTHNAWLKPSENGGTILQAQTPASVPAHYTWEMEIQIQAVNGGGNSVVINEIASGGGSTFNGEDSLEWLN